MPPISGKKRTKEIAIRVTEDVLAKLKRRPQGTADGWQNGVCLGSNKIFHHLPAQRQLRLEGGEVARLLVEPAVHGGAIVTRGDLLVAEVTEEMLNAGAELAEANQDLVGKIGVLKEGLHHVPAL